MNFFPELLKINFITRFKSKLLTFSRFPSKNDYEDILFSNIFIANTQVGHLTG